jgi:integrase
MGEKPYKPRQAKGTGSMTRKTAKIKDQRTGEIRLYSYYQASKLVEGFDPETGEPFRKRITASAPTQREAQNNLNKKIQFGSKAYEPKPVKHKDQIGTVGELLDTWITWKEESTDVRAEVVRKYRSYINIHLKPDLGEIPLLELESDRLLRYFTKDLPAKTKQIKVDGVWVDSDELYFTSTSSIQNIYSTLFSALKRAHDKGLIKVNPLKTVKKPPAQKRADNIGQLSHIAVSLLARLKADEHPDYCRFLLPFLGLRSGERLGIQLDDIRNINSKEAKIIIHSQLEYKVGGGWFISPKTKSGKERTIPLSEPFLSVVRAYVKKRKAWEKSPNWKPEPKFANLLFLNEDGSLINKKQDTKDWHDILEHYGYPYWQQHANRHITATLLGNQEPPVPIAVVRELLGHHADSMSYYYQTIKDKMMKKKLKDYGTESFARLLDEPLPSNTNEGDKQ